MGNVVEFTLVGGLKEGGGEGKGRAAQRYCIAFCSKITVPIPPPPQPISPSPPPRGFPKSILWKYIYKKSCTKENLLLSVVHLGNDSDAGLSFLYQ